MVSGRRAVVACVLLLSVTVIASDARARLVQAAGDPVRGPSATARVSPPSPRRAAADPAAPARGTLRFIVSPPQTVVTVNGDTVHGDQVSVPLGESVVRFTAPGYHAMSAEARITRAGESRVVRAALPVEAARSTAAIAVSDTRPPPAAGEGFLTVASDPAATVRFDGDSVGVTPLRAYHVPAGEYYLRVGRAGYRDAEQMITVRHGATTSLTVSL
ncbi:MAG: PEGA domain-containing protein, partial [Gemmatimonadota bacterium]